MKMSFDHGRFWRPVLWAALALALLLPLAAMPFTTEVNWSAGDFIMAAVLLIGLGVACELIMRLVADTTMRVVLGGIVLATVLLIWAEGAVGIF